MTTILTVIGVLIFLLSCFLLGKYIVNPFLELENLKNKRIRYFIGFMGGGIIWGIILFIIMLAHIIAILILEFL